MLNFWKVLKTSIRSLLRVLIPFKKPLIKESPPLSANALHLSQTAPSSESLTPQPSLQEQPKIQTQIQELPTQVMETLPTPSPVTETLTSIQLMTELSPLDPPIEVMNPVLLWEEPVMEPIQ